MEVFLNGVGWIFSSSDSSSSQPFCRRILDICSMWSCSLIFLCSGVCRSDIVIMYCNRGTFQALCWLLIGLQCNDCVILMTQIQLIVIFMSCEDCLFSLGLHGAEVYECVSERARGCREQRLISVYSSSSIYAFVFLKSGYRACSLFSMMWVSPFPNPIDMKRCVLIWICIWSADKCCGVIGSLCVTLRWKRDRGKTDSKPGVLC